MGLLGLGAYVSADVTYRWMIGDASGLFVAGFGVILGGIMILGVGRLLKRLRGMPVLSQFTLYLVGALLVGIIAVVVGNPVADLMAPAIGTPDAPGLLLSPVAQNVLLLLAVLIGGAFAAEISFLFGLPVLTLGSDYFGIATLGFSIVVQTLLVNSDTILPFPEMKGGRGMIGIPKLTTWFWAFSFMMVLIIVMRNLIYSSTGRAIMSVREDETAGKAMGIDVAHYKLLTFVIGSAVRRYRGRNLRALHGLPEPRHLQLHHRIQPADHHRVRRSGQHDRHHRGVVCLDVLPGRDAARAPGSDGHRGADLAFRALPDCAAPADAAAADGLAG